MGEYEISSPEDPEKRLPFSSIWEPCSDPVPNTEILWRLRGIQCGLPQEFIVASISHCILLLRLGEAGKGMTEFIFEKL